MPTTRRRDEDVMATAGVPSGVRMSKAVPTIGIVHENGVQCAIP